MFIELGQPPDPDSPEFRRELITWLRQIVSDINTQGSDNDLPLPNPFTPSNVTTTRSFDADATTVDELADVLGTLINDNKARGRVR